MTNDEEIAAIREAIASGAKKVKFRSGTVEKEVEYPSFDDMRARLNFLEQRAELAGGRARPRVGLAMFGRG